MTLVVALPGNEAAADRLAAELGAGRGAATIRRFPDGETYLRMLTPVAGEEVALFCTLARPDDKTVPLLLLARTMRELGATRVGLVAPYLPYLRQDTRFQAGESVTSRHYAQLLSGTFDWLVTVDPHLHRYGSLDAVYTMPARALHASPLIAAWIRANVSEPVIVGPDSESAQWVAAVAAAAGAPYVVAEKLRRGDRDVDVHVPELERWRDRTPVLVDDIVSTARSMIATVGHLRGQGTAAPVCIGVHAIFADRAHEELLAAGAAAVVTCNTVPHVSNAIDVTALVAAGVGECLGHREG